MNPTDTAALRRLLDSAGFANVLLAMAEHAETVAAAFPDENAEQRDYYRYLEAELRLMSSVKEPK